MATSKSKKRQKQRAAQQRSQHAAAKRKEREAAHTHLPKVGTPADDERVFAQSQRDVVDFGMSDRKRGWVNIVVVALVLAALVALVAFFVVY